MGCSPQYLYLGRVLGVEPQGRVPVHLAAGLQHALQLLVVPGQLERRTGTGLTAPPQGTGQQEQGQGRGRVGPRAAGSRAGGVKGSRAEGSGVEGSGAKGGRVEGSRAKGGRPLGSFLGMRCSAAALDLGRTVQKCVPT